VPASRIYEIIVIGAGSAGTTAALAFARAGRRVLLVEQRRLEEAGARWVNGVPMWMFDQASVERPRPPELRHAGRFWIRAANSERRICVERGPARPVDIRKLSARLHNLARCAGVEILERAQISDTQLDRRGRLVALTAQHEGESLELRASLFVDASGLAGALRRRVPRLAGDTPRVAPADLCTAAQSVHEIGDLEAARRFLQQEGLAPGDTLCTVGAHGGFSTRNISVDPDAGEVDLLTGSIADGKHPTGPEIVALLRRAHPWIGEKLFGGAGAIPIRRPYDRLANAGVALVGNSACQVFPAHGSGTGIGMIAARTLVRSAVGYQDPGSEQALWNYQATFHRRWSGRLAFYDLVRRHSQQLDAEAVRELLDGGILTRSSQVAALDQRVPHPEAGELIRMLPGLSRLAPTALSLARALGPAPALLAHYARFPLQSSPSALRRWSRRGARLRGDTSDLAELRGTSD
jgi:flavin-dependent dehydrogenase